MGRIKRLPAHLANQIAAGEVVERPASVVKELVENALDAGATAIEIRLHRGGRDLIEVRDNGEGLTLPDLELSVMPHATSKISSQEDLAAIQTLGFRGEALASMSAVSRFSITSRTREDSQGWRLDVSFGKQGKVVPAGCPPGTIVQVKDLFLEIPARYKFLKSRQAELSRCLKMVKTFAVCWPEVAFVVRNENRQLFRSPGHAPGASTGLECLEPLFGREILSAMKELEASGDGIALTGFIASPDMVRLSSRHVYFFLNRRPVTSPVLWKAVNEALRGRLVKGNFPAGALFLDVEPCMVDVNVHPSKAEVRFQAPDKIYRLVYHGVRRALSLESQSITRDAGYGPAPSPGYGPVMEERLESGQGQAGASAVQEDIPLPWEGRAHKGLDKGLLPGTAAAMRNKTGHGEHEHSSTVSPEASRKDTPEFRVIGQFARSFILVEKDGSLLVFDQHAAHEGLLFKRLVQEFEKQGHVARESLAFPHVLDAGMDVQECLEKAMPVLQELGIEVSLFGQNQVAIRSVPYILTGAGEPTRVAEKIVLDLLASPARSTREALRSCFSRIACSMAVKAGARLEQAQMAALVQDCLHEGITHCPHGRPVTRVMTADELCRGFFRK